MYSSGEKRLKMLMRLICFSTLEVVIKHCDRISLLLSRHQSSMLTLSQEFLIHPTVPLASQTGALEILLGSITNLNLLGLCS